ncbi:MAG: MoxR family ATPase [Proteobacteria bacterium]|nr:MAG: MoxR family ATPase [Pseudomonadota bacterium]
MMSDVNLPQQQELFERLSANLARVIIGQDTTIRLLLSAFLTKGHVLLEDFPGTGKTTFAKALARSVGADFQRIQFTPDLLPTDILGVSVFNPQTAAFEVHQGPIFSEILLADEINRASPRTQSALLQAMGEGQISLDGTLYPLSDLFFVIATQNPVEFHGTYPLPEAQMDRFAMRLSLGYVTADQEVEIMTAEIAGPPLSRIDTCIDRQEVIAFAQAARNVEVSAELKRYAVDLCAATRNEAELSLGASPRASITLIKCAQSLALFDGSGFVTPDHIQELATVVIAHRLVLDANARFGGATTRSIVARVLSEVPVPR